MPNAMSSGTDPPAPSDGGTIPSPEGDSGEGFGFLWHGEVRLVDRPTGISVIGHVEGGYGGDVDEDQEGMLQGIAISASTTVLQAWEGSLLDVDADELEKKVCDEARPQLVGLGLTEELIFGGLELTEASRQALEAALASDAPLQPGSRVSVAWSDGKTYAGTLVQIGEGRMLVTFPDGQQRWVTANSVTPL